MKRSLLCLLLVLALLLSCAASAEAFNTVALTDMGISIDLPADWEDMALNDEDYESGLLYGWRSADCSEMLMVNGSMLGVKEGESATPETIADMLNGSYDDVTVTSINNIPAVTFSSAEDDMRCVAIPNADYTGVYLFMFLPATDDFAERTQTIINSITLLG